MVTKADIPALLRPFGSAASFAQVARMMLRYGWIGLSFDVAPTLSWATPWSRGSSTAFGSDAVPVLFEAALATLVQERGRVLGAVIDTTHGTAADRSPEASCLRRAGSMEHDLRRTLFPEAARPRSLRALTASPRMGPRPAPGLALPLLSLQAEPGSDAVVGHDEVGRERGSLPAHRARPAKPGLLASEADGRRFVNEADSYHDFVSAMLRGGPDGHGFRRI